MGLLSFIKNAGSKLFGKSEEKKEQEKAALILAYIQGFGFDVKNIQVTVDDETVTLTGEVDNQVNKNKIIVAAGNVEGISRVEDNLTVLKPVEVIVEPEKQFYTVVSGDTLSKIAKQVYGNANKYPIIFEANTPMLKHPDKIYPGQVLVIPPLS